MAEDIIRSAERELKNASHADDEDEQSPIGDDMPPEQLTNNTQQLRGQYFESQDNLLVARTGNDGMSYRDPNMTPYGGGGLNTPNFAPSTQFNDTASGWGSEWDKRGADSPVPSDKGTKEAESGLVTKETAGAVEEIPTSRSRRMWVTFVWLMTWWIPSFVLKYIGRMKRPDVRMAWREKLTICILIFFLCATIIFYIIWFGKLICPKFDKAWNQDELAQHQGTNDFWVAVAGEVYDVSKFWHGSHSDIANNPDTPDIKEQMAGQDLTNYFPPPLSVACPGLVDDTTLHLTYKNFTPIVSYAVHTSGPLQPATPTKLNDLNWYPDVFLPKMKNYHKGTFVWEKKELLAQATDENIQRNWAIWDGNVYDLTDYFNSIAINQGNSAVYTFLNQNVTDLFKQQPGEDISQDIKAALSTMSELDQQKLYTCMRNMFYLGQTDFRKTARCQVQNYLLLIFSSVLVATILAKFLAALQLGGKRSPEMLDKFVICQVPCYTEGEESLRHTIDSLAALKYDDKRKLLFIICDGNIIGSGNDRPTPRIVLDILGVDPKLDPEPLLFKSIGEGARQLNYGKVYSGLYEFEGHVVPYMVVVKVGKPSERSKPGNRGKRDSQILLMHYLNRVHFDAPMSPLELEIYHQMRNVIGIDPAFYEYIFMVDADTSVTPDSLNRLVACTADDSSIIGICGETKLHNEEGSWWTMIQVYEYYISHHLAKSFESLFGSVTCLPGCFSMYRIRTADKGRPLIISTRVIEDYAESNVDTLHKKNLLSLGEDRYLTTIMMKYFPTFKMKFTADAIAHTTAPDRWSILLSQRRRWINSTVHNLIELVFLPELCGFCCFSMRFVVFIDLLGTLMLPATAVYLVYLIVTVASRQAAIPIISLVMIGAVYGLQAVIFILKREFMLVGWMIIYILAYPIYSFFLPIYSFWCMDDFSWGNTRVVIGEGSNKKVVVADDDKFDESMIPLKKFSEYEAEAWETGSHHSDQSKDTRVSSAVTRSKAGGNSASRHTQNYARALSTGNFSQYGGLGVTASQFGGTAAGGGAADFYRDTNITYNNSSNPNLKLSPIRHTQSMQTMQSMPGPGPTLGSGTPPNMAAMGMPNMMMNGSIPHLPGINFGSNAGSDYGGAGGIAPSVGYPMTQSMYGLGGAGLMAPRNSVMTNLNAFGGAGSVVGAATGPGPRPMSTFSLATTMGPMGAMGGAPPSPSMDPNPSDEEVFNALRHYLSTQDLMSVTKKTAREAMIARFPKADMTARKEFLNTSIDKILSQS